MTKQNKEFLAFLENSLKEIDRIDKETPWTNIEPRWWLKMMDIRRSIQDLKNGQQER